MRINKVKKITAIILVISILAGIMAVCTGLFAGAASDNLLKGGSFESTKGMWNEAAQNTNGNNGYTGKKIGVGQHNIVAEGWAATNDRGTRMWIDHTTDSKEGNYALKFNIPSATDTQAVTVKPYADAVDTGSLTTNGAYYKFTAWVKGTNSKSRLEIKTTDGKVYKQEIPAGQTWHKVELDNVFLSKTVTFGQDSYTNDQGKTSYYYQIYIVVDKDTTEETELYIDNLSLSITDNVLADGGFETAADSNGFTDKYVGRCQTNMLTKSFLGYHDYEGIKEDMAISVDHSDAGRSGYALHFKMPANSGTKLTVFPYKSAHDLSVVKAGYYTLSVWVKSTSSSAKLEVETNDKTYKKDIPLSMEWQKVSLDNIYLADGASNLKSYKPDTQRKEGYAIKLIMSTVADYKTELMVDDISLTPIEFMSNADFENGISGWLGNSTSGATADAVELTDAKSGSNALKLSLPASSGITVSEVALPKTDLVQGFYMFAFYAKGSGTLKAETAQGRDSSNLDCTLSDEWQLFVQKDIVVDSGELNALKFVAENTGSAAAEIYIDNVQFYRQVGPGGYIDMLNARIDKRGELQLTVPPEGYQVSVLSSSNEGIIALDGTVTLPAEATTVDLVLKMTNINDETDTAKSEKITVNVPAEGGSTVVNNPFIINNGFEGNTILLKTTSGGVDYPGIIGRGQTNTIVEGWNGFNWWEADKATNAPVFTMTAGRSGNDALKVTCPAGQKGSSVQFYPTSANIDTSSIEGGKYKLSVWVRGTNGHTSNTIRIAALKADGKTVQEYSANITSGEEWHEIVINDIYLTPGGENLQNIVVNGKGASPVVIKVRGVNDTETYLEFDDITLTRTGDAGVLKDDSILQNGSFERNGVGVWGFQDKTFPKSQCNYIIEGWRSNQWSDSNIPTAVSHVTDSPDGKYSLKFNVPTGANTLTMVPDASAVDTTKITSGFYDLTFWTKGVNAASKITVKTSSTYIASTDKEYSAMIAPSLEWQKITIKNIYLTEGGANLKDASCAWENGTKPVTAKNIAFSIKAASQDTELYIDNIALTKAEDSEAHTNAIIIDGGFEDSSFAGYADHVQGQAPKSTNGYWAYQTWGKDGCTPKIEIDTNSGNAVLNVTTTKTNTNWLRLWLRPQNVKTSNITAGTYKLSVKVKGTNTEAYIALGDEDGVPIENTMVKVPADAATEWKEIAIDNITINSADDLKIIGTPNGGHDVLRYSNFIINVKHESGKYVLFDDLKLTLVEEATNAPTLPPIPTTTELLPNNSFETTTTVWNSAAGKSGWDGFADRQVTKGQANLLVDGWRMNRWNTDDVHPYVTHTTDSHTGTYALKFRIPAGCGLTTIYPRTEAFDKSAISAGYYILKAWVKGDNTASELAVKCTSSATGSSAVTYTESIPASTDWQLVTLGPIYLTDGAANLDTYAGCTAGPAIRINLKAASGATADTNVYIDDISLRRFEGDATLLSNNSFETTTTVWNGPANKSGWDGFTDRQVNKGQSNLLVDGWRMNRWNTDDVHPYVTHTTDSHTGTYALKFRIPAGCATTTIFPKAESFDKSAITAGYYVLTAWVKGDNTASELAVKCTSSAAGSGDITYSEPISTGNGWHLVMLGTVYLTDGAANLAEYGGITKGPAIRINLKAASGAVADTNVYMDDICLTKVS